MRILLLAHTFPPYNAMGAVRATKLAEHFLARGHDVRVLTGAPLALPATMTMSFPADRVIQTRWLRVEAPLDLLRQRLGARLLAGEAGTSVGGAADRPSRARRLVAAYRDLVSLPDGQAGWLPYALAAGRKLLKSWRPDLVYSTALPFTSHLIASRLARSAQCPWVGEYRDLFTGNPYNETSAWRERANAAIERRVMASAAAIVAVTPPWRDDLAARYGKPCAAVPNGFDPGDFTRARAMTATANLDPAKVTIVYTGIIYPGRRDPSALFDALARLGAARGKFAVRFYGPSLEAVSVLARRHGVEDVVKVLPPVSHLASLGLQMQADLLLLLQWNDPRERAFYAGKLFEYIGAGRPILMLGCEDGVSAQLIRERRLGLVSNDAGAIAQALAGYADEKSQKGTIELPGGPNAARGLSRADQFSALETFLTNQGLLTAAG